MKCKFKKMISMTIIGAMLLSATGCGIGKKAPDNAVAVVNGEVLTIENYNKSFAMIEKNYNEIYGDTIWTQEVEGQTVLQMVKSQLLTNMIEEQLIIEQVKKTDFKISDGDMAEAYKKFMDSVESNDATKKLYAEKGIDEAFVKKQIESEFYREAFDKNIQTELEKDQTRLNELYKTYPIQIDASHILVTEEAKANEILKKIKDGGDFAALAKENSIDTGSAKNGGDLGLFPRGVMVQEFEDVAFNLKVGEVSPVVQSKFGYHIIKLNEIQTLETLIANGSKAEEIEVYKRTILSNLTNDETKARIAELKKSSEIETFPDRIK